MNCCSYFVTSLLSSKCHIIVIKKSPALKPYKSEVTQELNQGWAPLHPGSCPLPLEQEPERPIPVWLGNSLGGRRLGMKSSPRDHTATKLKGEPTQMDFGIPRSMCLPGLGILGLLRASCSWAERGLCAHAERERLPFFSSRISPCPGTDEGL